MIFVSQRIMDELELGMLVCTKCKRLKQGVKGLAATSFAFCCDASLMIDWDDAQQLLDQGKLAILAETGFMNGSPNKS